MYDSTLRAVQILTERHIPVYMNYLSTIPGICNAQDGGLRIDTGG